MGKTFVCSVCRNGIIGGGLYIDEQSITYSTQKLTVSPLYRNQMCIRDSVWPYSGSCAALSVFTYVVLTLSDRPSHAVRLTD